MGEHVRVGVIGTSWWADLAHLAFLKSHPQAEIAALCGRNREHAVELARKYDIPRVFTDYREMLEKASLQAVVIATPDDQHYAMTMDALDAGLHVLCEKPLALNAAQARAMYAKAEARGVKHMVLFTYRGAPHMRYLKQLVDEGYVGRCFHARFLYLGGYDAQAPYAWRFDRQRSSGMLGDLGSHMIDLARWLVGDIVRVSAHLAVYGQRPGPEGGTLDPANDAALLTVEFANGAQGTIQASAVAHPSERLHEQRIALHGADGTLEMDAYHLGGMELRGIHGDERTFGSLTVPDALWGDVDRTQVLIGQVIEAYTQQPVGDRLFIDSILEDRPVSPSFYDGLRAQEIMEAALASHAQGCWVNVAQTQP